MSWIVPSADPCKASSGVTGVTSVTGQNGIECNPTTGDVIALLNIPRIKLTPTLTKTIKNNGIEYLYTINYPANGTYLLDYSFSQRTRANATIYVTTYPTTFISYQFSNFAPITMSMENSSFVGDINAYTMNTSFTFINCQITQTFVVSAYNVPQYLYIFIGNVVDTSPVSSSATFYITNLSNNITP